MPGDDVVDDVIYEDFNIIHHELALIPDTAFASIEETIEGSPATTERMDAYKQQGLPGRGTKRDASSQSHVKILWRRGADGEAFDFPSWSTLEDIDDLDARAPYPARISYRSTGGLAKSAAQLIGLHLKHIQVHLPFEVMPAWAARALDRKSALRASSLLAPATHLESMAAEHPVLVATHSDRLLEGLSDPARAAVLCELDPQGKTRLLRPDAAALARWLERYRGLGEIRGAGHEASIFTRSEPAG